MKLATALALAALLPIVFAQGGPPPRPAGVPSQGPGRANAAASTGANTTTETIRLLGMRSVQSDLALASDEIVSLGTIARSLSTTASTEDAALAAVAKALNADQLARLKELLVQDLGYNALALADVRARLSLSEAQSAQITSLVSTLSVAKAALDVSTDAVSAMRAKAALAAKTSEELAKILTDEQDKKLRALAGKTLGAM